VVYEDDVLDAVRAQLAAFDGVLIWVNPIHEGRNRANHALLREVAARGVWGERPSRCDPQDGTKEVLHRTRTMNWGCDTALYRTAEAIRAELPMIWEADFMLGPPAADETDSDVLGEINVSSAFPIHDDASAVIARRVADRLQSKL
jgi:hypothetical protein